MLIIEAQYLNNSFARNKSCRLTDSTVSINSDSLNLAEGKKLYEIKCGKCHPLYNPNDYKLKVWKENLDEMKYKAALKSDEYEKNLFIFKS